MDKPLKCCCFSYMKHILCCKVCKEDRPRIINLDDKELEYLCGDCLYPCKWDNKKKQYICIGCMG